VGDITLGDADAVGLEELSGAVLVDGEVASLLESRRVLDWAECQSQRGPDAVEELRGPTLTAWKAEAACLLRASLNMAEL
jgi:phage terminase large subunit-like protein